MIAWLAIAGFLIAGACAGVRLLVGPSLADRAAALDVALVSLMGAVVVWAVVDDDTIYLNLLAAVAIVGFTAAVAASQFIEHDSGRP